MDAQTQYKLSAMELDIILCVARTGTLSEAGLRLGLDDSTISRALRRIEKGLGQRLFDRSRSGAQATELALLLARHAERIELELDAARALIHSPGEEVAGTIHITTTDAIASGVLLSAIQSLSLHHPRLEFKINTGNELLSLSKRDADLALRATQDAPEHLVGKNIGLIHSALYAGPGYALPQDPADWQWISVDDALPEHPSVRWRKQDYPSAYPGVRVNSILAVADAVLCGLGVGALPLFLAARYPQLKCIQHVPDRFATQLWLLMHPDSRHVRRVTTVFQHLSATLSLAQPAHAGQDSMRTAPLALSCASGA
jgi:DNA-binding transcriptional LysR family regulator